MACGVIAVAESQIACRVFLLLRPLNGARINLKRMTAIPKKRLLRQAQRAGVALESFR